MNNKLFTKPIHLEQVSKNHPFKIYCLGFIKQNFGSISQREIARRLKIGKTTVNNWSRELGLFFKKHTVNENFFKKWSKEMAYILGYIAADGNIAWDTKKTYNSLTITASHKDKEHLERSRKVMDSSKPLLYGTSTNSYRLIVANKVVCRDLMNLGIKPKKSLSLRFPKVPKKYLPHFIRGVIDGDGTVRYFKRPRSPYFEIVIVSGSLSFIRGLRKNILSATRIDSNITGIPNRYFLRYSCTRGINLARWVYKDATLYLERKYNNYKEAINVKKKGRKPFGKE